MRETTIVILPLLISVHYIPSLNTVQSLIKATPGVRTPVYKGHFTESQKHSYVIDVIDP